MKRIIVLLGLLTCCSLHAFAQNSIILPPSEYQGRLGLNGVVFTMDGLALSNDEMTYLVGADVVNNVLTPAIKKYSGGLVLNLLGGDIAAIGVICLCVVVVADMPEGVIPSLGLIGGGGAMLAVGIPLTIKAKRSLKQITDDYNRSHGLSSNVTFGATRNGMGIALNF